MRVRIFIATVVALIGAGACWAQTPGVIYTFAGTGDTREWRGGGTSFNVRSNTVDGVLTVTEVGDEFDPGTMDPSFLGQDTIIADGWNRVREQSTASGGIDLTGLDTLEIDVSHNGAGNVNVQFFIQAGINGESYTWANLPDHNLTPNTIHTLQFPLGALTPAQRSYIRTYGLNVRDHAELGYLTWNIYEVRSVGTPLTQRDLATHDTGTTEGGLNGAYVNFDQGAILGNDGGQNQTGLSHNPAGSGSLQWTDKGGVHPNSGGAVTWGNGTAFNGNSFFERPTDVSNYDQVIYRMSATDVTPGGGGEIGIQAFFQTGNYEAYQVAGTLPLPVDGQFHDLVFPLSGVTNRQVVPAFGVNLDPHANDVIINVDLVRFVMQSAGLPGDYNENGVVDAADYVVWRNAGPTDTLPNDPTPGTVDATDYQTWVANFGRTAGAGSVVSAAVVPEPACAALVVTMALAGLAICRRRA